jgi:hypothetical protein
MEQGNLDEETLAEEELQDLQTLARTFPIVVIALGIIILVVNVLAGYWQWHFWLTVFCSGLIYTAFRVGKRALKNAMTTMMEESNNVEENNGDASEEVNVDQTSLTSKTIFILV